MEEEEEKEEEAWRKEGGRYGAAWPKEEGGEAQGINTEKFNAEANMQLNGRLY